MSTGKELVVKEVEISSIITASLSRIREDL
jgi:hypothetical protein